jgi:hypothetical protein
LLAVTARQKQSTGQPADAATVGHFLQGPAPRSGTSHRYAGLGVLSQTGVDEAAKLLHLDEVKACNNVPFAQ